MIDVTNHQVPKPKPDNWVVLGSGASAVLTTSEEVADFLDGKTACDLSGEGTCEACQ